ncbi:MAG: nucleotidyltransferase family protein [Clostridiales Family XIII bacterium]|jgi:CTP:molybdopterin cytidylyltransferase MocA|nr:nucleotidyltransferase family protein [Clostridiales Family XIII bacterium]
MKDVGLKTVAVILAAGLSSRMGAFKPLLEIGGAPALARLLGSVREAGVERAFVVTGHRAGDVARLVADEGAGAPEGGAWRAEAVHNPGFEGGMFTSVQAGVRAAAEALGARPGARAESDGEASGALLFPVDVPLVSAGTICKVKAYAEAHPDRFAQPCFGGRNGHPLFIPAAYFEEILGYAGAGGLKAVRDAHADVLAKIETDDEGCVLDMDTPEDLEALRGYDRQR